MFRLSRCDDLWLADPDHCIDHELVLDAPRERVFEVVSRHEHEAHWFPDFSRAEWLEPPGPGARRDYRLSWLRLIEEFTVWEPGERLSFWVSGMSLPLASRFGEDYRLSAAPGGATRLTWRVAYSPNRWLQPVHPWVRPWFVRDFRHASEALKRYVDAPMVRPLRTRPG